MSFLPLNLTEPDSIETVLSHIDYTMQYGEDEEPKEVCNACDSKDSLTYAAYHSHKTLMKATLPTWSRSSLAPSKCIIEWEETFRVILLMYTSLLNFRCSNHTCGLFSVLVLARCAELQTPRRCCFIRSQCRAGHNQVTTLCRKLHAKETDYDLKRFDQDIGCRRPSDRRAWTSITGSLLHGDTSIL